MEPGAAEAGADLRPDSRPDPRPGRRAVLLAAGTVVVAGAGVTAAAGAGLLPIPAGLQRKLSPADPTAGIPAAAEGDVRLERRVSRARGRQVGFFTAAPAGHGGGTGLPVCLVLHGASASTADFRRFGLARFLTAAVQAGAAPFVLAGADGGRTYWAGDGAGDDPQAMLRDELPRWCAERGFDTSRIAAYGWSMGGHGALAYAQTGTGARAVAALSPAVARGDQVFGSVRRLAGVPVGLWCGLDDPLLPEVQALGSALRPPPEVAAWSSGGHTREFWNRVTPAAFALVARHLG
jgi:S-formylglutathione hydrolase FrmB